MQYLANLKILEPAKRAIEGKSSKYRLEETVYRCPVIAHGKVFCYQLNAVLVYFLRGSPCASIYKYCV